MITFYDVQSRLIYGIYPPVTRLFGWAKHHGDPCTPRSSSPNSIEAVILDTNETERASQIGIERRDEPGTRDNIPTPDGPAET